MYSPNQRQRWLREAKAMMLLGQSPHSNIVKYLWLTKRALLSRVDSDSKAHYTDLLCRHGNRYLSLISMLFLMVKCRVVSD